MNNLLQRITVNPNICFGKPCIRGTRMDEILEDYPHLQRDDILAALAYGAEMSRECFVDIP
jgi:uncharacterized protein (DUF433 family)